jgi:MoaA/NifB/PqqE/SkfB family radical SAM enzyme
MRDQDRRSMLIGWRKQLLFARVAVHVAVHFARESAGGRMAAREYLQFLYRALLFLGAVRHNKVVRRGDLYKLQLYMPAYPSRAFFHALEKLHRPQPGPTSVVLSMTRACTYHCPHCYQRLDRGKDLDQGRLVEVARAMQEIGVSTFDIEGGEPFLRPDRLLALMEAIDDRAEVWVNTTGANVTPSLVARLKAAGLAGVMVSIHAADAPAHDAFTGVRGSFDVACAALRTFSRAGAFTAINCCPSPETASGDGLRRLFDLARDLGCDFVQVIHGKSAGGWLGRIAAESDSRGAIETLQAMHLSYNNAREYRRHPCIAAQVFDEQGALFGCTAGGIERFYVGADGEVQPCEFLNVSFGNVNEEPFATIFARMRACFQRPGTDWLCCTQADSIAEAIREHGLHRTPVPWEITRTLIGSWPRGAETPLYEKLGIYR